MHEAEPIVTKKGAEAEVLNMRLDWCHMFRGHIYSTG